MKTCQRRKPAVIKDTAYVLRFCNRMELFGENTQRIPETRSYKTLQSKPVWHKGRYLLFPKSGHRFNLRQQIRDCHINQLQATKGFLFFPVTNMTGTTAFPWHLSLPIPSVAPLFQRKAAWALAPATTPAFLPKPNHVSKERIFFLAGSETFKDSSSWMQHRYGARKLKRVILSPFSFCLVCKYRVRSKLHCAF